MVRVFTFMGLLAGTYVGVKALDNVVIWMERRRQENLEDTKLEREAAVLKQKMLRDMKERQATLDKVPHKHQQHSDKHHQQSDKHQKHTKEHLEHLEQPDDHKFLDRHQEGCTGEVVAACAKCGEVFEITEKIPHSPRKRTEQ